MLTLPIRLKTRYDDISMVVPYSNSESLPCQWYENIQELRAITHVCQQARRIPTGECPTLVDASTIIGMLNAVQSQ
jgi:hypothetical protein